MDRVLRFFYLINAMIYFLHCPWKWMFNISPYQRTLCGWEKLFSLIETFLSYYYQSSVLCLPIKNVYATPYRIKGLYILRQRLFSLSRLSYLTRFNRHPHTLEWWCEATKRNMNLMLWIDFHLNFIIDYQPNKQLIRENCTISIQYSSIFFLLKMSISGLI